MLFKRLPDEIFKPLAGPNRYLFEEILLAMFRYFSDEELTTEAIFPRRGLVIAEIEELLERKGRLLKVINEDIDGESVSENPTQAARYIYDRLVRTGWLEEEQEGYHVNVLMPPHASLLMEALEGVAQAEKKNYGSTVASITLQLDAIARFPEENAHAFIEVVRSARDFTRHLQSILTGIRGFRELIARHKDPKQILETFFDDFVETVLISDYKSLQAENNPFRHRTRVLNFLLEIQYSEKAMAALSRVYSEDKSLPEDAAKARVLHDLQFIQRVFQSVDRRLEAIDFYRVRLESRVAEMVRYLDRSIPDLTNRGIELLKCLGNASREEPGQELPALPMPGRWFSVGLVGQHSLQKPRKKRQPQFLELPPEGELDPAVRERKRLLKEYLQRRTMTPARVAAFLDRQMGDRPSMSAADFHLESIEDLVAFAFTPTYDKLISRRAPNRPAFTVRRTGRRIENEWMEFPEFIVERKG